MANSRIMLTCKHCGEQLVIGKGYYGSYHLMGEHMSQLLNEFYEKHESGVCSGDIDCSDCARDHFVILEEGECINDWIEPLELVRCRDCMHRIEGSKMCAHPKAIGWDAIEPEDDDFCSYGERREE